MRSRTNFDGFFGSKLLKESKSIDEKDYIYNFYKPNKVQSQIKDLRKSRLT